MRICLLMALLGLSACASLFERDPRSGYGSEDDETCAKAEDLYEQKRKFREDEAREELGYQGRVLDDGERGALETRVRLKRLEANLATKRDKRQYYGVRSALRNDRERIYFLSLPTYEARERWAANRGLTTGTEARSEEEAKIIEGNDIAIGMTQKSVLESWGDPDAVEVAGNPLYGFERWKYNRYMSGNEGYQKEMRMVYFEGGRVVGWERP